MAACLVGLGSNVGDREATLQAALAEIDDLPDVRLVRHSEWHRSRPLGGPSVQGEYLNAAAVVETIVPPLELLTNLEQIESRYGRKRAERWAARTLDLDLLLYGNAVSETEMLILPHPRMSFRRFVLEPAAKVAPRMLHPIIGWPVERLLLHLNAASDLAAIVSPSEALRGEVADAVFKRFGLASVEGPAFATAEQFWPRNVTTWIALPRSAAENSQLPAERAGLPYAAAAYPKLSILLDAKPQAAGGTNAQWSAIVRRPGRGPTLRLQTPDRATIEAEVFAAMESVWPDLGPTSANRLESK